MSEFITALSETVHKPEWVTAYATIVIALFTILLGLFNASLAKSTRRAAIAAENALIELERPWVFVEGARIIRRDMPGQEPIPNNWYISTDAGYGHERIRADAARSAVGAAVRRGILLRRPACDRGLRGADMRQRRGCGGAAANDLKRVAGSPADDPATLPLMSSGAAI